MVAQLLHKERYEGGNSLSSIRAKSTLNEMMKMSSAKGEGKQSHEMP